MCFPWQMLISSALRPLVLYVQTLKQKALINSKLAFIIGMLCVSGKQCAYSSVDFKLLPFRVINCFLFWIFCIFAKKRALVVGKTKLKISERDCSLHFLYLAHDIKHGYRLSKWAAVPMQLFA